MEYTKKDINGSQVEVCMDVAAFVVTPMPEYNS